MTEIRLIATEIYKALRAETSVEYDGIWYNVSDMYDRQRLIENILANNPDEYRKNSEIIDRLTDAILYEDLSDTHPDKMSRTEYPIMSQHQLARRQFGAHREKSSITRIEVPLESVMHLASDGKDYRYPKRRQRTLDEMIYMDEVTVSRNKERRESYREFVRGKSKGVFTVEIQSGKKTVHNPEMHEKILPTYI